MARIDVAGAIESVITFGQAFGKIDHEKAAELRAMAAEQKKQFASTAVDVDFGAIDWTKLLDIVQKLLPIFLQILPYFIQIFTPKPTPTPVVPVIPSVLPNIQIK